MNFHEREKKYVKEKNQFVEIFYQIVEEQSKGKKWGSGKYTAKERDHIFQGVVERLYVKEMNKKQIAKERGVTMNDNSKIIEDCKKENASYSNIHTNSDEYKVCQLPISYDSKRYNMY